MRENEIVPKRRNCVFMGIPRNFPTGTVRVERQAVEWVDGPDKTGGDGAGNGDRSIKLAGEGPIVERESPELEHKVDVGREQQSALNDQQETQEAFS